MIMLNKYQYDQLLDNERARIATLIHNQLAQDLTALMIHSQAIKLASKNGEILEHVSHINKLIGHSRKNVKNLLWGINNYDPDSTESLYEWLQNLLTFWKVTAPDVFQQFNVTGDLSRLPTHISQVCNDVVTEAITNVYRHAASKNLILDISLNKSVIQIQVIDDGSGFDNEYSTGLKGIINRLSLVEGVMQVSTELGKGTEVLIRIPLSQGH